MDESFAPQGEERVTKKFVPPCSHWDIPTLENWFAEKAADGWLLIDWAESSAPEFVKTEAEARQFWLEPVQKDAAPSEDERLRHESMGWMYLCRSVKGAFYLWRSTEASARKGRLYADEDSYAYSRVKKSLRSNYLWLLAVIALLLAAAWIIRIRSPYPVWRLVADTKIGFDIFTFALSMVGAFLVDRRERKAMRRLKRSLAEGEAMQPVGRTGIVGKIVQRLPLAIAIVLLLAVVGKGADRYFSDWSDYADHPVPFISAETLGGTASDEKYVETRHTLLGGKITLVSEGKYAGAVENYLWVQYSTQLEIYEPQLAFLAKPLARDVYAQYFKYCEEKILDSIEAGKAYYSRDIHDTQRLLLYDDGAVLYYRTDAPDDLRQHLDGFTALLRSYQND